MVVRSTFFFLNIGGRLKKKSIKYIIVIKDISINIVTNVRVCDDESNVFYIKIELHQMLTLNSYIFHFSDE
jgi:hypothetical protein